MLVTAGREFPAELFNAGFTLEECNKIQECHSKYPLDPTSASLVLKKKITGTYTLTKIQNNFDLIISLPKGDGPRLGISLYSGKYYVKRKFTALDEVQDLYRHFLHTILGRQKPGLKEIICTYSGKPYNIDDYIYVGDEKTKIKVNLPNKYWERQYTCTLAEAINNSIEFDITEIEHIHNAVSSLVPKLLDNREMPRRLLKAKLSPQNIYVDPASEKNKIILDFELSDSTQTYTWKTPNQETIERMVIPTEEEAALRYHEREKPNPREQEEIWNLGILALHIIGSCKHFDKEKVKHLTGAFLESPDSYDQTMIDSMLENCKNLLTEEARLKKPLRTECRRVINCIKEWLIKDPKKRADLHSEFPNPIDYYWPENLPEELKNKFANRIKKDYRRNDREIRPPLIFTNHTIYLNCSYALLVDITNKNESFDLFSGEKYQLAYHIMPEEREFMAIFRDPFTEERQRVNHIPYIPGLPKVAFYTQVDGLWACWTKVYPLTLENALSQGYSLTYKDLLLLDDRISALHGTQTMYPNLASLGSQVYIYYDPDEDLGMRLILKHVPSTMCMEESQKRNFWTLAKIGMQIISKTTPQDPVYNPITMLLTNSAPGSCTTSSIKPYIDTLSEKSLTLTPDSEEKLIVDNVIKWLKITVEC